MGYTYSLILSTKHVLITTSLSTDKFNKVCNFIVKIQLPLPCSKMSAVATNGILKDLTEVIVLETENNKLIDLRDNNTFN